MADNLPSPTANTRQHAPAQAVFQQEWRTYRTLIDENYLFHREAYACLHQILVDEVRHPFRFLDIACGDATASVDALTGTQLSHYYGIDLSAAALDLAGEALAVLPCPVTLDGPDGLFLIYEDTSPDGEDRDSWLRRWDDQQPVWTAYTPGEWKTITAHVHAADYPETASRWVLLGHEAGFAEVQEVYVAPSDLFRLYVMRPSIAAQ